MHGVKQRTELIIRHRDMNVAVQVVRRLHAPAGRILFVNGAIATLSALRWAEHGLDEFELVLFDFPMVGRSAALNPGLADVGREDEAAIVAALVGRFRPDYLVSLSWGGAAALSALSQRPASVRRAIVASFAHEVSAPLAQMSEAVFACAAEGRFADGAAAAVEALGEHLPSRLKASLARYFLELEPRQIAHILRHMRDTATLDARDFRQVLRAIDTPVLFANGAWDRFAPPEAARAFAGDVRGADFTIVPNAGHFLGLESRAAAAWGCDVIRDWCRTPALSRMA